MKIKPHFVEISKKPSKNIFENVESLFKWRRVKSEIRGPEGKVYFQMNAVEAPAEWSQLAIDIAASKYFRKTGVGKSNGHEKSVRQMVRRVVDAIQKSGKKQKYFQNSMEANIFASELTYILLSQRAFFNSPVWFNCGLYESYKINKEKYEKPQVSACFIQSVEDSIEGIFALAKNEALLFKYGSGSGTNFSNLRSKYENLEGGGTSSGLISFLDVLDRGAASVKSGGITRRAAKMVCLDIDHPEVLEFIEWKAKEEKKAKILIQAGIDFENEGESYRTVSGQNANNSIRVSNAFMRAIESNKEWSLKSRTSGKVIKKVKAKELWDKICTAAYECADPGLQFNDTINEWHTCPMSGEIRASNPCSEYMFLDDSACNLASINLLKFVDVDGGFDFESYIQTIEVMFLAQDILVDYAGYPTQKIAQNSKDYRPLGLGFCGLGAFLMRKGISYDCEEARQWAALLSALLGAKANLTSSLIAKEKGAFKKIKENKLAVMRVIKKHHQAFKKFKHDSLPRLILQRVDKIWQEAIANASKYGLRNAQCTVMAPTGTIGLVMDCETTGIEPEFSLVKTKKLSGGGELKLMPASLPVALKKLGYSADEIDQILFHLKVNETLLGSSLKTEHESIFSCAVGKPSLSVSAHLLMMASIQPFLSGAISKTVNLPEQARVEDISQVYQQAWKLGLKSVSIYRDNSKGTQPLTKGIKNNKWQGSESGAPHCPDCGSITELAGGCFRCLNCGTTIGCA